jgi:hypothetical protein
LVGKANKCVSQKLFKVLGNLMWRNDSKWDPSREPQTIAFLFFLFWQEDFLMVFFAGENKNYTRKALCFQKKSQKFNKRAQCSQFCLPRN